MIIIDVSPEIKGPRQVGEMVVVSSTRIKLPREGEVKLKRKQRIKVEGLLKNIGTSSLMVRRRSEAKGLAG